MGLDADTSDPASISVIVSTLQEQVTHLKGAIDNLTRNKQTLENGEKLQLETSPDSSVSDDHKDESQVRFSFAI